MKLLLKEGLRNARPDLAPQIRFNELPVTVWVLLPRNRCIIYSRVEYRGVAGWAIVTPDSKDDALIEENFSFGLLARLLPRSSTSTTAS